MLAAATITGIMFAAPAQATPEDDYLAILAGSPGFTVNPFTAPMLTGAGHTICGDLRAGMSPEDAAAKMMSYPGATNAATVVMVSAARQTLCTDV